jgi:hypothetical protein
MAAFGQASGNGLTHHAGTQYAYIHDIFVYSNLRKCQVGFLPVRK